MLVTVVPFFWVSGAGDEPAGRELIDGEVLGHDLGSFLVVVDDGSVRAVDPDGRRPTCFVNSSRPQFERCLMDLAAWYDAGLPDDEAAMRSAALADRLRRLDPAAVGSHGWWPKVVEQIEAGLV